MREIVAGLQKADVAWVSFDHGEVTKCTRDKLGSDKQHKQSGLYVGTEDYAEHPQDNKAALL